MGQARIDISGKKVGMLTVLSPAPSHMGRQKWLCQCDCGQIKAIRGDVLRSNSQQSCGCRLGAPTHRRSNTSIHWIWQNMMRRCYKPSNSAYKDYGGRGIAVCERWHSFDAFFADMGERPDGKTLERVENDKGYSPENCRWATRKEQSRNRRANRMIELNGEIRSLAEWCEILGQPYPRINRRIHKGMDPVAALMERSDLRKMDGTI